MKRFYAMFLLVGQTRSQANPDLKSVIKSLKNRYPQMLSARRYSAFFSCFIFTDAELQSISELIKGISKARWSAGTDLAVDEHTIAIKKPSEATHLKAQQSGDPIPHHYIPRKPHPNCLLIWLCGTKSTTTGLSYILDLEPDLSVPTVSGRKALRNFASRWSYAHRPHFVVDSALMGRNLVNDMTALSCFVTGSTSKNEMPWMWKLLKRGTKQNHWCAAVHSNGMIASLFVGEDQNNEKCCHKLLTNAYKVKGTGIIFIFSDFLQN